MQQPEVIYGLKRYVKKFADDFIPEDEIYDPPEHAEPEPRDEQPR